MSIHMYRTSVPVFIRGMRVLSELIDKSISFAQSNHIDIASLVEAKLAPDMYAFAGQIQRASDSAKFAGARLTDTPAPSFADDERTMEDLKARCARTISYLESLAPASFAASAERSVTFGGKVQMTLKGEDYLLGFAIPNFFFHVTTAYDILRHKDVPIGKMDYLGRLDVAEQARQRADELLNEGLEESFPASDTPSVLRDGSHQ
jgi:hypothetical protein